MKKTALEARFAVSVNATCTENMTERNIQKILSITEMLPIKYTA